MMHDFQTSLWHPIERGPMIFGLELPGDEHEPMILRFRNPLGTLAQLESEGGCWTFKRIGVWQPSLSIRDNCGDRDYGVYRRIPGLYTGGISTIDSRRYRVIERMPNAGVDILNEAGEFVVSARPAERRLFCRVETSRSMSEFGDDAWLIGFAWYVMLLSFQDAQESQTSRMALSASRFSIS